MNFQSFSFSNKKQKKPRKENKYIVQRVINVKQKNSKIYYLVQWENYPIQFATWQTKQSLLTDFKHKIQQFHQRSKSQSNNLLISKQFINLEVMSNPYTLTSLQGHFLYGDKPKKIKATKVYQKGTEKIVFCEVQWKKRTNGQQNENFKPRDSWLEIDTCNQYAPQFMVEYMFSKFVIEDNSQEKII